MTEHALEMTEVRQMSLLLAFYSLRMIHCYEEKFCPVVKEVARKARAAGKYELADDTKKDHEGIHIVGHLMREETWGTKEDVIRTVHHMVEGMELSPAMIELRDRLGLNPRNIDPPRPR